MDIKRSIDGLDKWSNCILGTCENGSNVCLLYDKTIRKVNDLGFCADCKYHTTFSEAQGILLSKYKELIKWNN